MALTIKQFSDILKKKLPTDKYTIKGEIRQPKISNGHLYMILKDESSKLDCIVWKSKKTNTISELKDGDMIEVVGMVDYYIPTGSLKFIIDTISISNTIGDMYVIFDKLKKDFKSNGYFDKKLSLPKIIKKILILTSMNGAAIHDFLYTLNNNKSLVECTKIDVVVQGSECPKQIIDYINNNDMMEYDMVVITRGGGSMEDLWGFNDKILIETIYMRKVPVLSAIGHTTDTTIMDYVADITTPTPSLAAQFIVDHNKKYIDNLYNIKEKVHLNLLKKINMNLSILDKLNYKDIIKEKLINKLNTFKNNIIYEIKNNIIKLDMIKMKADNNYIALYSDNIKVSYEVLKEILKEEHNKKLTLVWNDIVIEIDKYTVNC